MYLRIFAVIWSAILMTSLLFAALISLLDLGPPRDTQILLEMEILRSHLQAFADTGGVDAAQSAWGQLQAAHPGITVVPDPTCSARVMVSDDMARCLALQAPTDPRSLLSRLEPMLMPLSIGALISAVLAAGLTRLLIRPLRRLGTAMGALARGSLQTRVSQDLVGLGSEMAQLGTAFDSAAARLQDLAENRRRLLHDLSHELRSPLARLGAAVGLLEKHPDRHGQMMAQMETDISRMDRMISELLTLSLLTNPEQQIERKALDLMDILEPILSDASFEGEPRGISVRFSGEDRLPMTGDAELLHRAIENTLRNAIAYSPDHSEVEVAARDDGQAMLIEIRDRGPGVAPEELSEMFSPFRRFASSEGTKGSGLGLAIAQRAVTAHDGAIEARLRDGGGLILRLRLPKA
ncbi:sensor histidine kinase [Pseudooceanicola nitratireducens]|uniref:sensor histidine kinase n=1 Tax=Pseudooceanicola nitratireducens TaxID=517719 RepID=UPI0035187121